MLNPMENRPWGSFTDLYRTDYTRVKTLTVLPGHRLSLQSHKKRSETWVVVRGRATIQIEDELMLREPGETILIPCGTKHRLENRESELLEIIEVQTGISFEESDIIRFEDDYLRA